MAKHEITLFDSIDGTLSFLMHEVEDIKKQLADLDKRALEDANTLAMNYGFLRNKVEILEEELKAVKVKLAM